MNKKAIIPSGLEEKYENWHFSPAIESKGFIFVSGCTGTRLDGSISENTVEQFRQAFKTVEKSLLKAGLTFDDVIEMTTYHVDLKLHLEVFKSVKDEFIKEPYPAWSAIGISELATDGAIIEVKVCAVRPDS